MTRLLLLLPLLAACAASPEGPGSNGSGVPIFGGTPEPEAPPALPANVQAALPPGASPSVVIPDGSGCYLLAIERTDPPSGFPLRDAAGNRVCDPGAAGAEPLITITSAEPPPGSFTASSIEPPAPIAPLDPT